MNHEVKDKEVIAKKLEEAKEAAGFIKDFVVQSKLDENGHFGEHSPVIGYPCYSHAFYPA